MILAEINVYPLKSARGSGCEAARVEPLGLALDRRWMIVRPPTEGERFRFLSQREAPKLATLAVDIVSASSIRIDGGTDGEVELSVDDRSGVEREVEVWSSRFVARDAGDAAARVVSRFLDGEARVVVLDPSFPRKVNPAFGRPDDVVSFADGYPVLLANLASLDELCRRLPEPVPMSRFRPNLVVKGDEPFQEDAWAAVKIGDVEFELAKPCDRCVMIDTDQSTGEVRHDVLKTLATFRRKDSRVLFGENLIPRSTGEVRVGDHVEILRAC